MHRLAMIAAALSTLLALPGCGSEQDQNQQAAESMRDELGDQRRQTGAQQREQLERDGSLSPDVSPLGEMAGTIEEAAKNSQGEQAKVLARQAELLRELQSVMRPYAQRVETFTRLGGVDLASLRSLGDVEQRLATVSELIRLNERIDAEFPPLLREMGEIEGTSEQMEAQLVIIKQIRDADRRMYAGMRGMLEIVKSNWAGIQRQPGGGVQFGPDLSQEDLDNYNAFSSVVQRAANEQSHLQRQMLEMASP